MNITVRDGQVVAEFPAQHEECARKAIREGRASRSRVEGINFVPPGRCVFCGEPSSSYYKEGI